MSKLTAEEYEQQKAACDGLCDIDLERIDASDSARMPCVTCPFCKEVVDAILTPTTISCPACEVTVKR